jgi:hypothetical protein
VGGLGAEGVAAFKFIKLPISYQIEDLQNPFRLTEN